MSNLQRKKEISEISVYLLIDTESEIKGNNVEQTKIFKMSNYVCVQKGIDLLLGTPAELALAMGENPLIH